MKTSAFTAILGVWRRAGTFLKALAAFAGGIGVYAAAQAFWPQLLVWWPWLLAGVAGLAIYGAWWLWWRLPKRQVERLRLTIRDPKARADVEDNFRKTIGQLLGGAAVLAGAGFAYLQFQQQQTAAHDLVISNQVAKGFELLGHKDKDEITLRLGGIYALEGVMNTSKQYYQPVLEALCAFIRGAAETSEGAIGSDIRAALNVIGRRALLGEAVPDLRRVHFPKADLPHLELIGTDLSGADLSDAHLSVAVLIGTNLSKAVLIGADLSGAGLIGTNLSGADLSGANLSDANLSGADLSIGSPRLRPDPVTLKHQPAAAWRQSLPACSSSLALQSSL
jgi:uncharacterized protein YjbI with pentapeptide repeats